MFEPSLIMRLRRVCFSVFFPCTYWREGFFFSLFFVPFCNESRWEESVSIPLLLSPHLPLVLMGGEAVLFISSVVYGGNDLPHRGAWRQLWAHLLLHFLLPTPPLPLRFYWQTLHLLPLAAVLLTEGPVHRSPSKIWPSLSFTCASRDVAQLLEHILLFRYCPHVLLENYGAGLRGGSGD